MLAAPDITALVQEISELRGRIDGAMGTVQVALVVIGALLASIVGLVSFVFLKLSKSHEQLDRTVNGPKGLGNRVTKLETWREEHRRRAET